MPDCAGLLAARNSRILTAIYLTFRQVPLTLFPTLIFLERERRALSERCHWSPVGGTQLEFVARRQIYAMSTTRKTKPKRRFVVTKDGIDCGFASPAELGLGVTLQSGFEINTKLCGRRGLLVKKPTAPHLFASEKGALRYSGIAQRVAAKFRGTMVDAMPKLQPLLESGVFGTRYFSQ